MCAAQRFDILDFHGHSSMPLKVTTNVPTSSTPTLFDNHLWQVGLNYIKIRIKVDQRHGGESGGRTARRDGRVRVPIAVLLHHVRMKMGEIVRRPMTAATATMAVVGKVSFRRDDPVIPTQVFEAHVE